MNKKVIAAFQKGESWAFGEIYKRFLKPIQHYVGSRVPNESVAQELTQEIFLKVYRFSSSYRLGFAFTTWLWTIARNTVSDFKRRPESEQSRIPESPVMPEELPAPDASAELVIQKKDARRLLFKFTRILTPLQRRVLWLRLVAQLPYQEISSRMGLTVAAVKSLAHRAKIQLENAGLSTAYAELM